MNKLAKKIKGLGFAENAYESKPVQNLNPQDLEEYIIGQAINCLANGLAPHPGLIKSLAEDRLKL